VVTYIGLDEVGRGPLAGPVVAAGVGFHSDRVLKEEFFFEADFLEKYLSCPVKVNDSKVLSDKKRRFIGPLLFPEGEAIQKDTVKERGDLWAYVQRENKGVPSLAIGSVGSKKIDEINILQSSLLAMSLAVEKIVHLYPENKKIVLWIDGNQKIPEKYLAHLAKEIEQITVIKGDAKIPLIGAASILAKVWRDNEMIYWDKIYPYFNFAKNAGYPTKLHRQKLEEHGKTPLHRESFAGVRHIDHNCSPLL
jgi:ribonuclease HII